MRWRLRPLPSLVTLAALSLACSETVELRPTDAAADGREDTAADASDDADSAEGAPADATVDSPFVTNDAGRVLCDGTPCACDNGEDDDGDGLTDGNDPECTGPYDDDESSFATGIPGDNVDFCQDCFFDGNSGMGDDGCQYHSSCLYGEAPPMAGGAGCFDCKVGKECRDFCQKRTPNGCDCFGCCDVRRADGSSVSVYLASTCSLDQIDDEQACPRCTPTTDCNNECGRCELCPGRTVDDLPADCNDEPACEGTAPTCNEERPCPTPDLYCRQGCCTARLM